jgi:hypothetical protein
MPSGENILSSGLPDSRWEKPRLKIVSFHAVPPPAAKTKTCRKFAEPSKDRQSITLEIADGLGLSYGKFNRTLRADYSRIFATFVVWLLTDEEILFFGR